MPRTQTIGPSPNRPRPVYRIDDERTESGPDVSSEDRHMPGSLMWHLLPTPTVSLPRATPIPSDREQLIHHLMGKEHAMRLLLQGRCSLTDMEILLHSLLPVGLLAMGHPLPAVGRHDSTMVRFSCGESGHAAS